MAVLTFSWDKYKDLGYFEYIALISFLNSEPEELANLILEYELSHGIRLFISDVIRGHINPKPGRPNKYKRNQEIFFEVLRLLNDGFKLTGKSEKSQDGAVDIVAEQMNMTSDAVLKAYQTFEKSFRLPSVIVEKKE